MTFTLRPYQERAVNECTWMMRRGVSPLLQAPTGAGKTVMATEIVRQAPKPVLAIAHSDEIFRQTVDKFRAAGLEVGGLHAGTRTGTYLNGNLVDQDVVVAMQRTAWSRLMRDHQLGDYKSLLIDECHHIRARTWMSIVEAWPHVPRCGLTATPCRADGKGLGTVFDTIVSAAGYGELIRDGYLVDARPEDTWTWPLDMRGVRTSMGDYQLGGKHGVARRRDNPKRIGDCVAYWKSVADGKRTLCFASSVDHSIHLMERFVAEGVECVHLDGTTPKDDRRKTLDDLAAGRIRIVTNFGLFTEGFDCPGIECIILERPTKLTHLYLQMVGRGLRPAPDKDGLVIIDPVGCVVRLGRPTADRTWTLSEDAEASEVLDTESHEEPTKACQKCGVVLSSLPCRVCGWQPTNSAGAYISAEEWMAQEGQLHRLSDQTIAEVEEVLSDPDKSKYLSLLRQAEKSGRRPGWAYYRFKDATGKKPDDMWLLPDPRKADPKEFLGEALNLARQRGWRDGWAYHRFRKIYQRWPKVSEKRAAEAWAG